MQIKQNSFLKQKKKTHKHTQMAFVHKSARRFSQKPPTRSKVGPGTYLGHSTYEIQSSYMPFNSSSIRKQDKNEQIPGPGRYNVSNEYQKEKIITTNLKMDIKIVEVPKPNGVFKSSAKRFDDDVLINKGRLPGPEQKNTDSVFINDFRKQASLARIPSIPTAQQLLGYSENDSWFTKLA